MQIIVRKTRIFNEKLVKESIKMVMLCYRRGNTIFLYFVNYSGASYLFHRFFFFMVILFKGHVIHLITVSFLFSNKNANEEDTNIYCVK